MNGIRWGQNSREREYIINRIAPPPFDILHTIIPDRRRCCLVCYPHHRCHTAPSLTSATTRHTSCIMPSIAAADLADVKAKACAELGFSRQLKQPRRVMPPPPFWRQRRISCVVSGAAACKISCGGGDLSLLFKHLPMGCAPQAILSDRQ
jgi:hypothetical protein